MHSISRPREPRIVLDRWYALAAIFDADGYARAAEALDKSQSAVTSAVQKIELLLGVRAFEIQGREAVLTPGQMLCRHAPALIAMAAGPEPAAPRPSAGRESAVAVGVAPLSPASSLLECLRRFTRESPRTHTKVVESVHVTARGILPRVQIDLAELPDVAPGLLHDSLMRTRLPAVVPPDHPLHRLGRGPAPRDRSAHRQFAVRNTGQERDRRSLAVEVEQRRTVSHMAAAIQAVGAGIANESQALAGGRREHILRAAHAALACPLLRTNRR